MSDLLLYGRAFVGGAIVNDTLLTIRDGLIAEVHQVAHAPAGARPVEGVIVPGFVDVHVHGAAGADFMDADEGAIEEVLRAHTAHGTTALAATTLSASRHDLHAAVDTIARSTRQDSLAEICAVHLEGPYIDADRSGAQDRASIRPADIEELSVLVSLAPRLRWMVTIAPELESARAVIEHFRDRILFSIGHTSATFAEATMALEWGAAHFTHLYNAMTPLQHREPGVVGAAFTSIDATAELIADGVHVHPAALRLAVQSMPGRIALITDAIRACGMPDGEYKLYDYDVTVADGAARLANGTLAGSVLTMDAAVRNMVELAGIPIETALPLASEVPARVIGVGDRKGRLAAGFDADLAVLDDRLRLESVFVRGTEVLPAS